MQKSIPLASSSAALRAAFGRLCRSEQPDAKIYALSLAGKPAFAEAFLASLAGQGKLRLVDAVTFHGYPRNPDNLKTCEDIKSVVSAKPAYLAAQNVFSIFDSNVVVKFIDPSTRRPPEGCFHACRRRPRRRAGGLGL